MRVLLLLPLLLAFSFGVHPPSLQEGIQRIVLVNPNSYPVQFEVVGQNISGRVGADSVESVVVVAGFPEVQVVFSDEGFARGSVVLPVAGGHSFVSWVLLGVLFVSLVAICGLLLRS